MSPAPSDPAALPRRSWRPLTRSALEFFREGRRLPGYSLLDWLHGYVYARWPYLYIGIGVGEHPLSKWLAPLLARFERLFTGRARREARQEPAAAETQTITFADTYHGKVVPLQAAAQLVQVREDIRLPDLEKIIPYAKAREIVLRNPDHIVALECPCRSARANPCLPLDVCLIVGEPFASFIIEHQPERARWITQDEAVAILQAEDERGHVHHAFFKDAMLGRFYAICNCCACCCGAMQAQRHGVPMLAASGYLCAVDEALCLGCGECVSYCQFEALGVGVDGVNHVAEAACMGCGVCLSKCPQEALSLGRAPEKGEPLEIFALMETAALIPRPLLPVGEGE
jgi:Pyruvate/2-oxoacid:ferredoxin oxidoreductase delta subunit